MQRIEKSYRQIVLCIPILRDKITDLLQEYYCDFGFIDNEPDRSDAYELSQTTVLEPADQRQKILAMVKPIEVSTGGLIINCFAIDNNYFLDQTLNVFSAGLVSTSEDDFNVNDNGVYSAYRHFTAPYKDDEDKWQRAKDKIDDLFYSFMFCEAAFLHKAKEKFDLEVKPNIDWYGNL
jgi:hypothetical protein